MFERRDLEENGKFSVQFTTDASYLLTVTYYNGKSWFHSQGKCHLSLSGGWVFFLLNYKYILMPHIFLPFNKLNDIFNSAKVVNICIYIYKAIYKYGGRIPLGNGRLVCDIQSPLL